MVGVRACGESRRARVNKSHHVKQTKNKLAPKVCEQSRKKTRNRLVFSIQSWSTLMLRAQRRKAVSVVVVCCWFFFLDNLLFFYYLFFSFCFGFVFFLLAFSFFSFFFSLLCVCFVCALFSVIFSPSHLFFGLYENSIRRND